MVILWLAPGRAQRINAAEVHSVVTLVILWWLRALFEDSDGSQAGVELLLLLLASSLAAVGSGGAVGPRTVLVGWSLGKLGVGAEPLRTETALHFEVMVSLACYVGARLLRTSSAVRRRTPGPTCWGRRRRRPRLALWLG